MSLRIIVGLGNPGETYAMTRHNIGFQVVDELVQRHGSRWRSEGHGLRADAGDLLCVKPQTYMNRSGAAVAEALIDLELSLQEVFVVVDDIDLPLGRLRIRRSGGPGTHNGLRDICSTVGTDFPRLRIGIRGDEIDEDLARYVLSDFSAAELPQIKEVVGRAADAVDMVHRSGVTEAMNVFNRSSSPPDATG